MPITTHVQLDAAREQVEDAVRLYFEGRYNAGSTLAGASEELLGRALEAPTLGAVVGRAAAVAEAVGPEAGLRLLVAPDDASIASYQPCWAVRARMHAGTGPGSSESRVRE